MCGWLENKQIDQQNRIENIGMNPHIYRRLILTKATKQGKATLFTTWAYTHWFCTDRKKSPLIYISQICNEKGQPWRPGQTSRCLEKHFDWTLCTVRPLTGYFLFSFFFFFLRLFATCLATKEEISCKVPEQGYDRNHN